VDTVPCGFFWKWFYDEVGLYKEDLVRTEDNEFHARIRSRGWKFFMSPELMTTYYCRTNIKGFLEQAFGNGYWSVISWRHSSWRHLAPFGFVASLAILGVGGLLWKPSNYLFWTLCSTYLLSSLGVSLKAAFKQREWRWVFVLPCLFFLLHLTYGLGSWWALLSSPFKGRDQSEEPAG